ncbi:MAG: anhydro-N-acetylmuramic acid kinase [Phycisphaerales bacterium]
MGSLARGASPYDDADMPGRTSATKGSSARNVIGVMTGTSIDGLDAALVSIEGHGLAMRVALVERIAAPFPAALASRLRAAAEQTPMTAGDFARLARDFGDFHADALASLAAGRAVELVAAHGQTVFHAPPVSWQLLNAVPIVAALGCAVVSDLRQADLIAHGQGAPITPLADWVMFRAAHDRAVINLGGFCNATVLPGGAGHERVSGADICACNQVLDAVARAALGRPFDADGAAAASGRADATAVDSLRSVLSAQSASRRSLGTGDEAALWVREFAARLTPNDLAASAALAVGTTIGDALRAAGVRPAGEALLAGGGARHRALGAAIAESLGARVHPLDAVGVPVDAREAAQMAVLGALAQDGVPISLPAVTGRGESTVRDGAWLFPHGPATNRTHDLRAAFASRSR